MGKRRGKIENHKHCRQDNCIVINLSTDTLYIAVTMVLINATKNKIFSGES